MRQEWKTIVLWLLIIGVFIAFYNFFQPREQAPRQIAVSDVLEAGDRGLLRRIVVRGDEWLGNLADGRMFRTNGPQPTGEWIDKWRRSGTVVVFEEPPLSLRSRSRSCSLWRWWSAPAPRSRSSLSRWRGVVTRLSASRRSNAGCGSVAPRSPARRATRPTRSARPPWLPWADRLPCSTSSCRRKPADAKRGGSFGTMASWCSRGAKMARPAPPPPRGARHAGGAAEVDVRGYGDVPPSRSSRTAAFSVAGQPPASAPSWRRRRPAARRRPGVPRRSGGRTAIGERRPPRGSPRSGAGSRVRVPVLCEAERTGRAGKVGDSRLDHRATPIRLHRVDPARREPRWLSPCTRSVLPCTRTSARGCAPECSSRPSRRRCPRPASSAELAASMRSGSARAGTPRPSWPRPTSARDGMLCPFAASRVPAAGSPRPARRSASRRLGDERRAAHGRWRGRLDAEPAKRRCGGLAHLT